MVAPFADRHEAGVRLAIEVEDRLRQAHGDPLVHPPLVLALPRGGVPVAVPVAEVLGAPLDVLVVRKIGAPGREELAVGAVGPDGVLVVNHDVARSLGLDADTIATLALPVERERARRARLFRGDRPFPAVGGRTVVVVDDGIATGASLRAALGALDAMGADDVWVAVPLAPLDTLHDLEAAGRTIVCLTSPTPFFAVGQGYVSFPQVEDEEVVAALRTHATARPPRTTSVARRHAAGTPEARGTDV